MAFELINSTLAVVHLFPIMGKQQSKEEVIIAQTGSGVSKEQISEIGWMITAIIIMIIVFVTFFIWNHLKRRTQRWFHKQVHGRGVQVATIPMTATAPAVSVQMQPTSDASVI